MDKTYLDPGAVWGTVAGAITVIGPSKRPQFTKVAVNDTGQEIELILTDRHSSPILPGYTGMYKVLPKKMRPKAK